MDASEARHLSATSDEPRFVTDYVRGKSPTTLTYKGTKPCNFADRYGCGSGEKQTFNT